MRFGYPLYAQTLCMVLLYVSTLALIVFICFNAQFGIGWEALLKSPFGDHVDTIGDAISSNLLSSDSRNWNAFLKDFGKIYNAGFYVFDFTGRQLAGEPIVLPQIVSSKVTEMPPLSGKRPPEFHFHQDEGFRPLSTHAISDLKASKIPMNSHADGIAKIDDTLGHSRGFPPPFLKGGPPFFHAQGRFILHTAQPDMFWLGTRILLFDPVRGRPMPSIVLASSPSMWQNSLIFDFRFLFLIIAFILILSLIFWWPFIYQITRDLGELTRVTEDIADGRFDARIRAARRKDEIGRLAQAVNAMAQRLEDFLSGQKQMLRDISHELFSPLSRLAMSLELLGTTDLKSYHRHLHDISEEVDEMRNLINELLAFSKAGIKGSQLELTAVNLKAVVDDILPKLGQDVAIQLSLPGELVVKGERLLINRALSNILRNSVRYAGADGPISLQAAIQASQVIVTISDCGPGVPDDSLQFLGQPFFRPEYARTRSSGGTGLGLAIVKSCIEACNGSMVIRNRMPRGLEVELRFYTPDSRVDSSN